MLEEMKLKEILELIKIFQGSSQKKKMEDM
jgi:hypothetical protein